VAKQKRKIFFVHDIGHGSIPVEAIPENGSLRTFTIHNKEDFFRSFNEEDCEFSSNPMQRCLADNETLVVVRVTAKTASDSGCSFLCIEVAMRG